MGNRRDLKAFRTAHGTTDDRRDQIWVACCQMQDGPARQVAAWCAVRASLIWPERLSEGACLALKWSLECERPDGVAVVMLDLCEATYEDDGARGAAAYAVWSALHDDAAFAAEDAAASLLDARPEDTTDLLALLDSLEDR